MLANGIPVIVGQRLEPGSDISHYRVVKGYDDVAREFLADDPLQSKGPNLRIPYDIFGRMSSFGGFVPVYPPEKDSLVRSLLKDFPRVRSSSAHPADLLLAGVRCLARRARMGGRFGTHETECGAGRSRVRCTNPK